MKHCFHNSHRNDAGVALLLALLFIVLLTVIVVEYAYATQVDTALVASNLSDYQAQIAAKSAIAMGVSMLTADAMANQNGQPGSPGGSTTTTATTSTRAGSGSSTDPIVGGALFDSLDEAWAYGVPFQKINNAIMQCSIDDEYGKINLNAVFDSRRQEPNETLEQALRFLFEQRGAEEDPTDAILDWVDSDDDPRPNGAESDYYQSLATPYPCKNAPFTSVEELLVVRGITPELYFGNIDMQQLPLSELCTVHGHRSGRVNVNTAQPETLTAIGDALGTPGLADLVLEERQRMPFQNTQDLVQRGILPPQETTGDASTRRARPFIVASTSYRLHGNGIAGESRAHRRPRATCAGIDGIRLTDWKEIR